MADLHQPTIAGVGTTEAEWLPWLTDQDLPQLSWGAVGSLVVVAPHPDDEVLGVGGIMHDLHRRGRSVHVVLVTDGEASHPDSPTYGPAALAGIRRRESYEALDALGLPAGRLTCLGLPDGAVRDHEAALRDRLVGLLRDQVVSSAETVVLHPHHQDGHPDHEAVARAAVAAVHAVGAVDGSGPSGGIRSAAYPIWLWHHSRPGAAEVDWGRAHVHRLDASTLARKSSAVRCFASQIRRLSDHPADAPILPDAVLHRFGRPFEVLFL